MREGEGEREEKVNDYIRKMEKEKKERREREKESVCVRERGYELTSSQQDEILL